MRLTTLLLLLLLAVAGFSQGKKHRELEALERQRFEAMTKQDVAALGHMLSEQLTYTHSNGLVENKTEHLENIRTGKLRYLTMQPEEMQVRFPQRRTAVVTGIVAVTGALNGKEFNIRLRYTDAYVKQRGKWRLASWQSLRMEN
jgi:hypothetical protein